MAPMAIGIGLGVSFGGKAGGGAPPALVGNGVLLIAATNRLVINDSVTPANTYDGVPEAKIVTTRSSIASYYDSAGLVQTAAINTHRLDYDPRVGQPGYFTEEIRTNVALWSNDLTNVAWTKTNATAAKNQTGPDGVANSASSLTATGVSGMATQAITLASSVRYQSMYIKRLVGSGAVAMTLDNVTWTDVTVTAGWTRVEIPSQTVINPTVGVRLAVSGDSIAVWGVQNENGPYMSSVINTTTAATTRGADKPVLAGTLFPLNQTEGTIYVKAMCMGEGAQAHYVLILDDATTTEEVHIQRNAGTKKIELPLRDGGVVLVNISSAATPNSFTTFKGAGAYKLNDSAFSANGETAQVDTVCTMPTTTQMVFGNKGAGGTATPLNGWLFEAMYLPVRKTNAELQALSA